jgi:hypothetical protein
VAAGVRRDTAGDAEAGGALDAGAEDAGPVCTPPTVADALDAAAAEDGALDAGALDSEPLEAGLPDVGAELTAAGGDTAPDSAGVGEPLEWNGLQAVTAAAVAASMTSR